MVLKPQEVCRDDAVICIWRDFTGCGKMNCIIVLLVKYLITFVLSIQENEIDEDMDKSTGIPFYCQVKDKDFALLCTIQGRFKCTWNFMKKIKFLMCMFLIS